jgi:hypothetical protein
MGSKDVIGGINLGTLRIAMNGGLEYEYEYCPKCHRVYGPNGVACLDLTEAIKQIEADDFFVQTGYNKKLKICMRCRS